MNDGDGGREAVGEVVVVADNQIEAEFLGQLGGGHGR